MSTSLDAINVSVKIRREATKIRRRQNQLCERISERLTDRFTHNYNEMPETEIQLHGCMVVEELLRKNPELKVNLSKHRGLREALESEEVRTTLVKIGNIFVGTPGYNWELGTSTFTPHLLPIVPCNSDFHNAELAHIAIKSHRRSAFDLQKARGKRRPIIIIIIFPRFNPPTIFSNGVLPFSNPYGFDSTSCNNEQLYCVKNEVIP